MSEDLGGIDYTKIENQLVYGREKKIQDNLSCQIILNENIKSNETDIINPNALSIARKIKELKKDGYDNKDIIILLRNIRGRVIDYKKALDLYDIPSFTDNIEITFNDPEVKIFLNLLKIISNYYNDLELISVLLTPIGNFTEDDLSKIKNSESGYMYEYMKEYSNNDEIKDKINLFFHKINYYREKLKEMSLIDFSNFIAEDSYYIQYIESSFQGDLKVENLYSLFEIIEEYEGFADSNLEGFLKYSEKLLKESSSSLEPTSLIKENSNVVRIMSIHKSKGLESKVVFIGDLERKFSNQDIIDNFLISENNFSIKIIDLDKSIKYKSYEKLIDEKKLDSDNKSEEMRLLYVAMTRAEEKLYLVGKVDLNYFIKSKTKLDPLFYKDITNSMLDWILYSISRNNNLDIFLDLENIFNSDMQNHEKLPEKVEINLFEKSSFKFLLSFYPYRSYLANDTEVNYKNLFDRVKNTDFLSELDSVYEPKYDYSKSKLPYIKTVSQLSEKNIYKTDGTRDFVEENFLRTKSNLIKMPKSIHESKTLNPSEIGTIYHYILSDLDFRMTKKEDIEDQLNKMVLDKKLLEFEKKVIDIDKIINFYNSNLFKRITDNLNTLEREKQFTMKYDKYYVNGQIDGYFIEGGEYVIYDFKSDSKINISKYKLQLDLYSKALFLAKGIKVKEKIIYWINFDLETNI